LDWADLVFVMEKRHKKRITEKFPANTKGKTIIVLGIPDEYQFMDEELVECIKLSVSPHLESGDLPIS